MDSDQFKYLKTRRGFIRQAACAALGTAALTNTIRDLRFINAAMAQTAINDYKALVCVFLAGGNDSNNLIIPTIQAEYDNYAAIRTQILAIPYSNILGISPLNSDGHNYGFHPACVELQTLFGEGKLAPVFNVGTLVYPITAAQYKANSVTRPPQLFSHSDQITQWQTSIPDQPPVSGWGGRCADLLDAVNSGQTPPGQIAMAVSLSGSNIFEVGKTVQQYTVSTNGAVAIASQVSGTRLTTLKNILGLDQSHPNLQVDAYAGLATHALNEASIVNTSIQRTAAANFWTVPFPATITTPNGGATFNSSLSGQLKMVARLIDAGSRATTDNNGLGMKRQIFFCQVGGYDTHTNQTSGSTGAQVIIGQQANLLAEISQCFLAFQRAMEQLGLSNKVTTFTSSDFGRTFPANGQGSDHGWGSHHLVMGGAVAGQKTYGRFPVLTVNGPDDTTTGRWVPSTAVDQYAATLATWFGVDSSKLSVVFPNIGRFATSNLGFMNAT